MLKNIAGEVVEDLSCAIKFPIVVTDPNGEILACSQVNLKKFTHEQLVSNIWLEKQMTYRRKNIGTVWLKGKGNEAELSLEIIKSVIQEKYKKARVEASVTTEELIRYVLTSDDQTKVKESLEKSGITLGRSQYVFIIELKNEEAAQVGQLLKEFWTKKGAWVVYLNSTQAAWIVDVTFLEEEPERFAMIIKQLLLDELFMDSHVAYSGPTESPFDLPIATNEALEALKLHKQFNLKASVANLNKLKLYQMLASLPQESLKRIRELYYKEMQQIEKEPELNIALEKVLEHKFNLSEAARDLFVHRNTLLYRLEKIQKITGLDTKNFDDIVLLRILTLINKL